MNFRRISLAEKAAILARMVEREDITDATFTITEHANGIVFTRHDDPTKPGASKAFRAVDHEVEGIFHMFEGPDGDWIAADGVIFIEEGDAPTPEPDFV